MKEKIDWYQEVLELEPGSKVFFPLARLLVEAEQIDGAVQTLRHGLERHPEFIEARIYLIDLLFSHGYADQCQTQVAQLTPLFSRYAGFWQAWGSSLADGKERDAGLALTFLAAAFQQNGLSLNEVLARGLQSTLQKGLAEQDTAAKESSAPRQNAPAVTPNTAFEEEHAPRVLVETAPVTSMENAVPTVASPEAPSVLPPSAEMVNLDALPTAFDAEQLVRMAPLSGNYIPRPHGPYDDGPDTESVAETSGESEEPFSLRTRSMAEVLAEQGDYAGALEIYQELSARASTPEEMSELQYRMSALTAQLGAVQEARPVADAAPEAESEPQPSSGRNKVLSVLEALAERLENRAHG